MSIGDLRVSAEKHGVLGLLTLRRPAALNALSLDMVQTLTAALDAWAADTTVQVVAIRGEGARAFCAGGDIRAWVAHGPDAALAFLRAEYRLNHQIATYPKPFVALMHGITMGGGAGLSVHARYRIADPGLVFSMPETGIGFIPDIGSSHFLPRCPAGIGLYLALTAARIGQGDTIAAGLADRAVALADFDALLDCLARGEAPARALEAMSCKPGPAPLAAQQSRVAAAFGAPSVEGVLERLDRDGSDFAQATAATIRANAPTSLKLAYCLLQRGATLTLSQCLQQEYDAATRLFLRPDLREGVRAAVIEKDRRPCWQPSVLAAVPDAEIAALAAPAGTQLAFA
ncbi:MAG: enoyl-CoA hydratase/isomerase family protein [Alphaproteobacteria bacterium]|nr:enoyl-CoA hydratase/isomerase family protein [Alphaproteobacteria bacterium]